MESEADPALLDQAVDRVGHFDRHAVVDDLFVVERLVCVPNGRDWDLVGPELVKEILTRDAFHGLANQLVVGNPLRPCPSAHGGGSMPRIRQIALRSLPRPPAMCIEWTHSPSAHSYMLGWGSKPISTQGSGLISASCQSCVVNARTP